MSLKNPSSLISVIRPYAVATLIVLAAFLIKLATPNNILHEIPFLIFFSAVVISGIYGGFKVGIYATLLSALVADYFFLPPKLTFLKDDWHQDFKVLLYIVDCATMSALCGSLKNALENAKILQKSEVEARTSLEISNLKLEESIQILQEERSLRENFVATLTHDLRTPLTSAKLSAQLILKGTTENLQVHKLSHRIIGNMDRADAMIRDLLDANLLRTGNPIHLELQVLLLNRIATETVDELAQVHGNRLELNEGPEEIHGVWDKSAIRRIIENLVNNAVKYGSSGTPVKLLLKKIEDLVEITVHNLGNPISAEDQQNIFEPYKRAESATRVAQKGWGLGLTLTRGLTKALGGDITLRSSLEEGTVFTVTLPLDSSHR
jgi:signal transduction histidine kinase